MALGAVRTGTGGEVATREAAGAGRGGVAVGGGVVTGAGRGCDAFAFSSASCSICILTLFSTATHLTVLGSVVDGAQTGVEFGTVRPGESVKSVTGSDRTSKGTVGGAFCCVATADVIGSSIEAQAARKNRGRKRNDFFIGLSPS